MHKVAVTTMTGGANYGNALQNYAVLRLVEMCGCEAETLNVSTRLGYPEGVPETVSGSKKISLAYVKSWISDRQNQACGAKNEADFSAKALKIAKENEALWRDAVQQKQEKFTAFQNEVLRYTKFKISNLDFNLPKLQSYDAFVAGSDQVWNPYYMTNSMVEFLQMAPKEKRIALAPSFGISELPECRQVEFTEWLNEIPHLSVRESAGADIIKKLTSREVQVLLDPTFGLTRQQWQEFAQKPENVSRIPKKYVFCYFLGNRTKQYTKFINEYAEKNECDVIDVFDIQQLQHYSYSPQEFVWLLSNSKAVFTDSFHGCAFAINLNIPFVVFDRAGDGCSKQSSRISTVLEKTGLAVRRFGQISPSEIETISFETANRCVEVEREEMKRFLKTALDKATNQLTNRTPLLATKRHCTGCGACMNICSSAAINMERDTEGFSYPTIDSRKCVHCMACERVCPADKINKEDLGKQETRAEFFYSRSEEICQKSSSGGAFSEISKKILQKGGIVFGAGYDEHFRVCHQSAETEEKLGNLRTSKYVQSDMNKTYQAVKKELEKGRYVMFSGTPCQVVALDRFLGKKFDTLLLVDIICHGVPSPVIWEKYLREEHSKKNIKSISFRNKDLGWNEFSMKVEYDDGTYYRELATKDSFEKAFLENASLRPSCYQCQYKTVNRISDITIADYWGVEEVHPELREQQGVSLILIHSEKGENALKELENVVHGETDLRRAIDMNSGCEHSVRRREKRERFFELNRVTSVKNATNKSLRLSWKQQVMQVIRKNGAKVKQMLRKITGGKK